MNVITAYSADEAVATFAKYPAVDGIVMDAGPADWKCSDMVKRLRAVRFDVPVVAIGSGKHAPCQEADHKLATFDIDVLLHLLRKLFPVESKEIEETEKALKAVGR